MHITQQLATTAEAFVCQLTWMIRFVIFSGSQWQIGISSCVPAFGCIWPHDNGQNLLPLHSLHLSVMSQPFRRNRLRPLSSVHHS